MFWRDCFRYCYTTAHTSDREEDILRGRGWGGSARVIPFQETGNVLLILVDVSSIEWQIAHSQKHALNVPFIRQVVMEYCRSAWHPELSEAGRASSLHLLPCWFQCAWLSPTNTDKLTFR